MGTNGVLQNPNKLKFALKEVEWAGFLIEPEGGKPLPKHTEAIRNFPTPANLTNLGKYMALLQQVAFCYAMSPAVYPQRHLLKPSNTWEWDDNCQKVFEKSKRVISNHIEEGVRLFDHSRPIGMLTDWSTIGIGHILSLIHI